MRRHLFPEQELVALADDARELVVVVDHNAGARITIKKELEQAGFRVLTFPDGPQALSALHGMGEPPAILTLDIDMPAMDGFTCCQHLRDMEARGVFGKGRAAIPVVFVSASDTFEQRSRGFHLGSLQFIAKPFARGEILGAVLRALRPQSVFAGMSALVVDDNQGLRRMVVACLERIGLKVIEAENGRQAFELMKESLVSVDLVIVEFNLPVMRGDEFIHLARQLPELEHLPMLSLSGINEPRAVLQMFRAGASDYLVKPFIAEELLARVQVHLNLRRHMRRLEEVNRNLYDKAVNDPLTGLRNKRYFQEAFQEMLARARRAQSDVACLFFDLDHFKRINDTYGHAFGDYVLKTIGELVKQNIRYGDLAARFGGEEFVIGLPNITLENALMVAEKIRTLIEMHQFNEGQQYCRVTVSIGVASMQSHQSASAVELLQMADQALYTAKDSGRNQVKYYPLP